MKILNLYLKIHAEFSKHSVKIVDKTLLFHIYYKSTTSFNYLTYSSCHLSHTRNDIALFLPKRIINTETNNREKKRANLKDTSMKEITHLKKSIIHLPNAFNQN